MFNKKNLLYIVAIVIMSVIIPAHAVKWEDGGMNMGMYFDMDSISDTGNEVTLVVKFTNQTFLDLFSLMDEQQRPLSVCLMQATVDCNSGKPVSGAMLCYDKSGNVAIDEADSVKANEYAGRTMSCQEIRELKHLTY
jgi:hypothetical protein